MNPKRDRERRKKLQRRARIKRKNYRAYFKTDKWKKLRARILQDRGHKCERCGAVKSLTVHHKHYKNFRHERDEDLEVLCWGCHQSEHGRPEDYDYTQHNRKWKRIQ